MSLATTYSYALDGLHAPEVAVEVHLTNGLPNFSLVGLPDTEVKEARDRVRAAIVNAGFEFPRVRLTVNLAPADLPKESGRFDLPIALGILAASHQIPTKHLSEFAFAGELSLSGELRPIRGALAVALASGAHLSQARTLVLPTASAKEAAVADTGVRVLCADTLSAVCAHLRGEDCLTLASANDASVHEQHWPDLAEVRGQHRAKRTLEIAAAAQLSILMSGPPGSGKSMLAQRLPGILPPLALSAARESAAMLSLAGKFKTQHFGQRPFRSPHHTSSAIALVGGGRPPRPGEISLASHGILFLDELPEFDRKVLESLREPIETGVIHISRAAHHVEFPARFQLVAAMNPCPCGWHGQGADRCHCTPQLIQRYRQKLSGPLLDRIDLHIDVPAVPTEVLQNHSQAESSTVVRDRVVAAQSRQFDRQGKLNSQLNSSETERYCQTQPDAKRMLTQVIDALGLSARSYHRLLRVARTIADLHNEAAIQAAHIAEASQLRRSAAAI